MLTIVHEGNAVELNPDTLIIIEHATLEEYEKLANEDLKIDFDGERIYIHSPATLRHEELVYDILTVCKHYFESHPDLGIPTGSHFAIHLPNDRRPEPDVVVIPAGLISPNESTFHGVPLLVVEVISPSTRRHDLEEKKNWYMENQVPEIWLVDPDEESLTALYLTADGIYDEVSTTTDILASRFFEGLEFSATILFKE
ncbi:MAG TPA: Uma2 family endonuclease [Candidatus Lokiarchaeia archaeon]|nr:Uma2 family endonuclease [Candidatus Lokiarchaeia archaeon]